MTAHLDDQITVVGDLRNFATFLGGTPQEFTLSGNSLGSPLVLRFDGVGNLLWGVIAPDSGGIAADVAALPDGSALVLGQYRGTITFNPGTTSAMTFTATGGSTDYDIFIAKYDASGTAVWVKSAGGPSSDFAGRIQARQDGTFAITGLFGPSIMLGLGEPGQMELLSAGNNRQALLARYHANGELDWAVQVGGPTAYDLLLGLRWLSDGGLAVSGEFRQSADVEGTNNTGSTVTGLPSDRNGLVARYLGSGELVWARSPQGISVGRDVDEAIDGTIAAYTSVSNGVVFGAGEPNQTSTPSGIVLAHFAPSGLFSHLHYLGSASDAEHMSITPDGSVVHGGFFIYNSHFVEENSTNTQFTSAGHTDAYVACADVAGQFYWARAGGGNQHDRAHAIAVMVGGDVVIAGEFQDSATFDAGTPDQQTLVQDGTGDIFVARYTP